MSTYYQRARDLMSSPDARRAFDIRSESEAVRRTYGYTGLGQCCLLARRLVEAGCRFRRHRSQRLGPSSNDLPEPREGHAAARRSRPTAPCSTIWTSAACCDNTLVVMMGEMGRTPVINGQAGRDHWSMAQSILFAGGGVRPGQVIGATDRRAAAPIADPISVEDVLRTMFRQDGRRYDEGVQHAAGPAGADRRRRAGDSGVGLTWILGSCLRR